MRTLKQPKQTMKKIDKYPYRRQMTTDELMGRAINRLRFKSNIWEKRDDIDYDCVFQMVKDIRILSGLEPTIRETFEEGMRYRNIFTEDYKDALSELKSLCYGDW